MPTRWLMLLVLFLRAPIAYQFQTMGLVGPFFVDALTIDFAALATAIGLYMLPGVIFALPDGMLRQRFGGKRIVLLGLALMAAGGVLTGADSLSLVVVDRLLSGVGAVLISVLMTKM